MQEKYGIFCQGYLVHNKQWFYQKQTMLVSRISVNKLLVVFTAHYIGNKEWNPTKDRWCMRTARCARYKRPAVSIYQQMASIHTIKITDLYVDDIYYTMRCFRSHIWNVFFSVKTEKTRTWFIWFVWTRVRKTMNIEQILKQTRFSTSQWRGFHNNSFLGINCICMSGHTQTNTHTHAHACGFYYSWVTEDYSSTNTCCTPCSRFL